MALTGKYVQPQDHHSISRKKTPNESRFRGLHALRRYEMVKNAAALPPEALRSELCPALAITIESRRSRRRPGPPHYDR
jgi:formate hydrogenlyase subunit 6/NADH:ubiquinone oxidoreductase subunit I